MSENLGTLQSMSSDHNGIKPEIYNRKDLQNPLAVGDETAHF